MVNKLHSKLTPFNGIHGAVALTYPNQAARLAAGPFAATDQYKIAIQTDDQSLWMLKSYSPIVWDDLGGGLPAGSAVGDTIYFNGTDWTVLPAGSDGYVLTTHSTSGAPTWNSSLPSGAAGGDLTGTYPNPTIGANKVTFAKMQQVATDSLLGRDTAGTGNVETITLDTTLAMSGSQVLGRAAITGDITISAGSNTAALAAGAVVNADVSASAAIAVSKLANATALSVLGRSTNTAGAYADIVAGTDGYFLGRSGTTVGFIPIPSSAITLAGDVTGLASSNQIASNVIVDADVNTAAAIAGTKISPNFGSQTVTTTDSYLAGVNPASTGIIRLPNSSTIRFRNAANSGNVDALAVDASNILTLGNSTDTAISLDDSTDTITLKSANTNRLVINTTTVNAQNLNITTSGSLTASFATLGSNAASAGILRLPNANNIRFRNAANSADVDTIAVDASNNVVLGNSSDTAITLSDSSDTINLRTGGSIRVAIDTASVDCQGSFLTSTAHLRLGTNPAGAGIIRLANNQAINFRNAANSANIRLGTVDASDNVIVGDSTRANVTLTATVASLGFPTLRFDETQVSPTITQNVEVNNTTVADTLTISAQSASGNGSTGGGFLAKAGDATGGSGTRTGGTYTFQSGTGASADGYLIGKRGNNTVFQSEPSGTTTVGDGYCMVEAVSISGRRIVALARAATTQVSATQMPANTGDGVIFINNRVTAPTTSSSAGLIMWSGTNGELVTRAASSAGTSSSMYLGDGSNGLILSAGGPTQDYIIFNTSVGNTPISHQLANSGLQGNINSSATIQTFSLSQSNSGPMITLSNVSGVANISLFAGTGSFGGGQNIVFIANRTAAPSSNPTGGGILYAEGGALKYRGSSGTVTTLGPA